MNRLVFTGFLVFSTGSALASVPSMGGGMSHLLVTVFEQQVYLSFESPHMSTVELQDYGESYDGAASVLDHTGYNSQFGWLANGFISLPPQSGIFVRSLHSSPMLDVYSESGHNPILGTAGSSDVWQWDGTMVHNWYASRLKGEHSVSYEVFVGDLFGQPLAGFGSGTIDLNFTYGEVPGGIGYDPQDLGHVQGSTGIGPVPAPASVGSSALGMVLAARRRR